MQDLYEFMINFMREKKYKFAEKVYKHKHPSPYGAERQYVWNFSKGVDEVYSFSVDVYMHTYDAQDVPVKTKEGKIRTFTKGRIWIEIGGTLFMYKDKRWDESPLTGALRKFLNMVIFRKTHQWAMWDVVMYREMQKLVWAVRRRLKMEYDEYEQKYWTGVHG